MGFTAQGGHGEGVTAVIVHYRTPEQTLRAARAVALTAPAAEILVVDNDSRDDIAARLSQEEIPARVLTERENRGYGAACNRATRESRRPYLLFLNSDAYLHPGAVDALVDALEAEPGAAAAGPRLFHADGSPQPSIRRLPTPWRIFCESSGLAFLSGGRGPLRGHTATREAHDRRRAVDALMGAALLVRRSDFEQAGGFDEGFFLYAEETDLMTRWRVGGRTILFVPEAAVTHEGGASGGDSLFGQLHAALAQYVEKHHGRVPAAFARGALAAGALGRYAAALLTPGERGRARRSRYGAALRGRGGSR